MAVFAGAMIILSLLAAPTASATTPAPSGYVDASAFGGGFNATDATAALQAAIATGRNVWVPREATPWYITPTAITNNNQTILFESGAVVAAKPAAFTGLCDSLFTVGGSGDSLIGYGATLMMQKNDYMTQPQYLTPHSEWRMGVWLQAAQDCTIAGLTIKDTGGDGIYLCSNSSAQPYCHNVTIKDVTIRNAYRNGISVISANGLSIDNVTVTNTSGTAPQSGIDFEPNNSWEVLQNVSVRNTIINANAGAGIQVSHWAMTNSTIEHVTITHNNYLGGIWLSQSEPGLAIKDSLLGVNSPYGIYSESGQPNTITYSDLWGNAQGNTALAATLGEGCQSVRPAFYSTDLNSPYYMCLDTSCSPLITHGASDGEYMGARGVVPEPGTLVLLIVGFGSLAVYTSKNRR